MFMNSSNNFYRRMDSIIFLRRHDSHKIQTTETFKRKIIRIIDCVPCELIFQGDALLSASNFPRGTGKVVRKEPLRGWI